MSYLPKPPTARDHTTVPGAALPGMPSTTLLQRLAMPSLGLPITMLLQRLMATTLHLPKPLSAAMDHLTAGLLCIKSETSAWILGMGSMLRRAGGSTETSTTSCGLGMRLIAVVNFLDTAMPARGFVDYVCCLVKGCRCQWGGIH